MEPFQDDILTRRLDDLTHQMRMLSSNLSMWQLDQRQQRYADRWDLAEATQKTLVEMLTAQKEVLEHQRTINGRLATTLDAIKDLLAANGRDA